MTCSLSAQNLVGDSNKPKIFLLTPTHFREPSAMLWVFRSKTKREPPMAEVLVHGRAVGFTAPHSSAYTHSVSKGLPHI